MLANRHPQALGRGFFEVWPEVETELLTGVTGGLELIRSRMAQGRFDAVELYVYGAEGAAKRAAALMSVDDEGFTIAPLGADNRCTPYTVSSHMLYENSDPFRLAEPGGVLDVTEARYTALDARTVRVTGSRWEPAPYAVKLEGAGGGPIQTIMLVGIEDPEVMADLDGFLERMHHNLTERVRSTVGDDPRSFAISLRPHGWNAVSGRPRPAGSAPPLEIGLLFVATADTQAFATKPIGSGTGFGLSMIYGFVRQSGGQVRIYSEIGQGTTMCLYLPRFAGTFARRRRTSASRRRRCGRFPTLNCARRGPLSDQEDERERGRFNAAFAAGLAAL